MFISVRPAPTKGFGKALVLALLTIILTVSVTPLLPASATDSDAIAANPATAGDIDRSRTRFEYDLNAGQLAKDSIYVLNTGSTPQVVTLYARDAYAGDAGEFLVQSEEDTPKGIGSWVTFFNGRTVFSKTLQPKNFITVPFDVLSPVTASPGDHVGAVVVSAKSTGGQISVVKRVAVRLYAHISGQLSPRLKISDVQLRASANPANPFDSTFAVSYTIENSGNMELAADVAVRPTGFAGMSLQEPTVTRVSGLLPGSKQTVTTTASGFVQTGFTGASVVFTGVFERDSKGVQAPMGREDVSTFVTPWGWITILIFLVFVITALGIVRHLRKRRAE